MNLTAIERFSPLLFQEYYTAIGIKNHAGFFITIKKMFSAYAACRIARSSLGRLEELRMP